MKMISAVLNEIPGFIPTQQKYLLKVFNITAVLVMTNVPDLHTVTMEMQKAELTFHFKVEKTFLRPIFKHFPLLHLNE